MKKHNPNPGGFYHNESIPILTGPHKGKTLAVQFLFHGIAGLEALASIPSSGCQIDGEFYVLDEKRRVWLHAPKQGQGAVVVRKRRRGKRERN